MTTAHNAMALCRQSAASYANQERYMLSDQKSKIVVLNQKKEEKEVCMDMCTLNGKVIETVDTYTHIGVIRHSSPQQICH